MSKRGEIIGYSVTKSEQLGVGYTIGIKYENERGWDVFVVAEAFARNLISQLPDPGSHGTKYSRDLGPVVGKVELPKGIREQVWQGLSRALYENAQARLNSEL